MDLIMVDSGTAVYYSQYTAVYYSKYIVYCEPSCIFAATNNANPDATGAVAFFSNFFRY